MLEIYGQIQTRHRSICCIVDQYLTTSRVEHIVHPDLACTAGQIAYASTQQTLPALGKCIGPVYAVSAQVGL